MVGTLTIGGACAALVAGCVAWTFAEYALHRFWGHGPLRFGLFYKEHTRHHAEGHYMTSNILKGAFGVSLFFVSVALGLWLKVPTLGVCFGLGFSLAYGYYEYFHWSLHQYAAGSFYGRWARRHHFYHHFHDPRMNHGVTSPLWDVIFGTYRTVSDPVKVPRKLMMRWMCLEQRWPDDFMLRGTAR